VGELDSSTEELKNLLNTWIAQLQDKDKQPIKNLLMQLFPKLKAVWSNNHIEQRNLEWREQLRVCSLEIFPIYFRLTLSANELSNTQIQSILALATDAEKFKRYLLALTKEKLPDGTTKARIFLEQLENYVEEEIPVNYIPSIVEALLDVSDQILLSQNDEPRGILDFGDDVIISCFISRLLQQLDETSRVDLINKAIYQFSKRGQQILT
jgi:predicted KAP-like P-loop ATPase